MEEYSEYEDAIDLMDRKPLPMPLFLHRTIIHAHQCKRTLDPYLDLDLTIMLYLLCATA